MAIIRSLHLLEQKTGIRKSQPDSRRKIEIFPLIGGLFVPGYQNRRINITMPYGR